MLVWTNYNNSSISHTLRAECQQAQDVIKSPNKYYDQIQSKSPDNPNTTSPSTMPLVQIHLIKGSYTRTQIRTIADTIQSVMESHFHAPPRDRYQIITQHEPYELICEDTGLGLQRTEKLIVLHIFQQGRDRATKQATYAEFMKQLGSKVGIGEEDLIISLVANQPEDWSFGKGRAQFVEGDL